MAFFFLEIAMAQHNLPNKTPATKPPFPMRTRRAFHEAGHAAMAKHFDIEFYRVLLTARTTTSRCYQTAADYCRLIPGRPVDLSKLDQYVVFLMSGSVSEMIAIERYHDIRPASARQTRFRAHWYQTAWLQPEWHLDLAYYCAAFWTPNRAAWEIPKQLKSLWLRTCRLVQDRTRWPNIERIAAALMERKVLDAGQLLSAIEGPAGT
jgi:hypothetical protein